MLDIETKALLNYEKNLTYFSQKHPDIFKNIRIFDASATSYALEYKNGYFDVLELISNHFLYNCDSNEYAKQAAKSVNYSKTSSLFEGIIDYIISPDQIKKLKTQKLIDSDIRDVLPIMQIARKIAPKTSTIKKIDKFIFVGVGLGTHIVSIDEKVNASDYLIIEDDFELFRLSLFVTPYYEIAKKTRLTFSIAQNKQQFSETVTLFLEYSYFNNRYLKYFYFPAHDDMKIKLIQVQLARQSHHVFPYDISLSKYLLPLNRIANGYKTLNLSTKFAKSLFAETPAIVLAAGPSLNHNIAWLKEHKDEFIIIAASAILNTLHKHNIKPDIVTQIDGFTREGSNCMVHLDGIDDVQTFLQDTIFVFGSHVPDMFVNLLKKENVFFLDDSANYKGFGTLSTACVGSMSTLLAIKLGFSNIYLLGLDLAFDQKTGASHSDDHFQNNTYDLTKADETSHIISLRDNIVQTEGNFSKIVYTTPDFLISIQVLASEIPKLKDESQTIFNLNQGAYITDTQPTYPHNVSLKNQKIDKHLLYNKMFSLFTTYSASGLDQTGIAQMKQRLQNGYDILALINNYEKKTFMTTDKYMYDLLGIVSDILKSNNRKDSSIIFIFTLYFRYAIPYIIDIENTKEATKLMPHFKKIDSALIEGMLNIIHRYIEGMETFLENYQVKKTS